jgi:preprotein translocase subunit SecD
VVLHGDIKSIAIIQSQITNDGRISGTFTRQSAEDLALVLRSGMLPRGLRYVSERAAGLTR